MRRRERTLRCWPSDRRDRALETPWERVQEVPGPELGHMLSRDESAAVWVRERREQERWDEREQVGRRNVDEASWIM